MAIFRLEAKIISRHKTRGSIFREAAYCTGESVKNERTGKVWDLGNENGVLQTVILTPESSPAFAATTQSLWNEASRCELRRDAQIAREIILTLPIELDHEQQFKLAVEWAETELVSKGMIVQVCHQDLEGSGNPHAHLLCSLRRVEGDTFSAKKPREWNDKMVLMEWRESWGKAVNVALEKAGRDERVDHRSLEDQGIDRLPEPKLGPAATAMKRRDEDSERFKLWRFVKSLNFIKPWLNAIENFGQIKEEGMGNKWWEKSLLVMEAGIVVHEAVETVRDVWERMLHTRPSASQPDVPPPTRGRDLDMER